MPMAITGSFQTAPVLNPGIDQPPSTPGFRARRATAVTQAVPFHLHLPSGDRVDSHFWPSQNHCPSGEICPFWSTIPSPLKPVASR